MQTQPQKASSHITSNLTLPCPECGGMLVLRSSKYGPFYGCTRYPLCEGTHGAHPDGLPLGIPADKETKQWRIKAHQVLAKLYQGKNALMTRSEAYCYMQELMNLSADKAHISMFSKAECKRLIELLE